MRHRIKGSDFYQFITAIHFRENCNIRFQRRFGFVEQSLAGEGLSPDSASLEKMDALWEQAKQTGG